MERGRPARRSADVLVRVGNAKSKAGEDARGPADEDVRAPSNLPTPDAVYDGFWKTLGSIVGFTSYTVISIDPEGSPFMVTFPFDGIFKPSKVFHSVNSMALSPAPVGPLPFPDARRM